MRKFNHTKSLLCLSLGLTLILCFDWLKLSFLEMDPNVFILDNGIGVTHPDQAFKAHLKSILTITSIFIIAFILLFREFKSKKIERYLPVIEIP